MLVMCIIYVVAVVHGYQDSDSDDIHNVISMLVGKCQAALRSMMDWDTACISLFSVFYIGKTRSYYC